MGVGISGVTLPFSTGRRNSSTRKLVVPSSILPYLPVPPLSAMWYTPSLADLGILNSDTADKPLPGRCQASGRVNSSRLPTWVITTCVGNWSLPGIPRPPMVWARIRCFIDTVSPARSRLRSSTVWATISCCGLESVSKLKRQLSMPRCQSLQTNAMSALPSTVARALTK